MEAAIYTFSHSIVYYFLRIIRGCNTEKLIKCDTGELDEKYHYASDILIEWHHV